MIPNLVSTVKGYAAHEKETFERVVQARNAAISAQGVQEQAGAENMLSGALRQLFALVENYPELKANTNFMQLQEELTNTEGKIAFSRQFYNDTVLKYIRPFSGSLRLWLRACSDSTRRFTSTWMTRRKLVRRLG